MSSSPGAHFEEWVGLIALLLVLAHELLCMSALRVQIPWHGCLSAGVLTRLSASLRNHDSECHGTSVNNWQATLWDGRRRPLIRFDSLLGMQIALASSSARSFVPFANASLSLPGKGERTIVSPLPSFSCSQPVRHQTGSFERTELWKYVSSIMQERERERARDIPPISATAAAAFQHPSTFSYEPDHDHKKGMYHL